MGTLPVVNLERLDLLFDGDRSLLAQVLEIVESDFPELCTKLGTAIQNEDRESIHRHAHTLKGSLANVGGDNASSLAAEIDTLAGLGNLNACYDNFILLNQAVTEFLAELRRVTEN